MLTVTHRCIDQRIERWIILVNNPAAGSLILSTCLCSVCISRFGGEQLWIELSDRPNVGRRFHIELRSIQNQRIKVLLVELQSLLRHRYQLRSMIKLFVDDLAAKLSIGFCEQLMFVPYLIDDFRRSDVLGAYDAKKYEFLVFSDGAEGELRSPSQLAGKFVCERFR